MSLIGNIEADIVIRLTAALTLAGNASPQVDVQAWPQRPKDYRMSHPIGAALVIYHGADYQDRETAVGMHAMLNIKFELNLMARNLRESTQINGMNDLGMYEFLELCRNALMGWQPALAAGAIAIKSDGFEDYHEGVWQYAIKFAMPVAIVGSNNIGSMFGADIAFGGNSPPISQLNFDPTVI